jgi:hypothetical protein
MSDHSRSCVYPENIPSPAPTRNPAMLSIGQESGTTEHMYYNNVCYSYGRTPKFDPTHPTLPDYIANNFHPSNLIQKGSPLSYELDYAIVTKKWDTDATCYACERCNDGCDVTDFNGHYMEKSSYACGPFCQRDCTRDCIWQRSFEGFKMASLRRNFTGEPIDCCFNNFECAIGDLYHTYNDTNMPESIYERAFSDPHFPENPEYPNINTIPKKIKSFTCSNGDYSYFWNEGSSSEGKYNYYNYYPYYQHKQPNHRNLASESCVENIGKYCTGLMPNDDYNSSQWLDRWVNVEYTGVGQPKSCPIFIENLLYNLSKYDPTPSPSKNCSPRPLRVPGTCGLKVTEAGVNITPDGAKQVNVILQQFLKHYTDNGFKLGSIPGSSTYHPAQDVIFNEICCPYPEVCSAFLGDTCAEYTLDQIQHQPNTLAWCGCYLQNDQYESYAQKYNMSKECTPTCNRIDVIPIIGPSGDIVKCTTDACIMDDVTVNIVNSTINGGVTFNQVCGNCTGGSCTCIVENDEIDIYNSTINGTFVPISQSCGSFHCSLTNYGSFGPRVIVTECLNSIDPLKTINEQTALAKEKASHTSNFLTILFIIIILLIILIMIILLRPKKYANDEKIRVNRKG